MNKALEEYLILKAHALTLGPRPISRQAALEFITRARASPELMKVYTNRSHPGWKGLQAIADDLRYWAYEHPQRADGAPMPLTELPGYEPPLSDPMVEDKSKAQGDLSELQMQISLDPTHPYFNREHPEHAQYQNEMLRLIQTLAPAGDDFGEGGTGIVSAANAVRTVKPAVAANAPQGRLAELRAEVAADKSHPYWNRSHPDHKQYQAEMQSLFEARALHEGRAADPDSFEGSGAFISQNVSRSENSPSPASGGASSNDHG